MDAKQRSAVSTSNGNSDLSDFKRFLVVVYGGERAALIEARLSGCAVAGLEARSEESPRIARPDALRRRQAAERRTALRIALVFEVSARLDAGWPSAEPVTLIGAGSPIARGQEIRGPHVWSLDDLEASASRLWPGEDASGRSRLAVPSPRLLARIVREAKASDILGQSLQDDLRGTVEIVPSPLARVAAQDFAFFRAREEALTADTRVRALDLRRQLLRYQVGEPLVSGSSDVSLRLDETTIGAVVFNADSMIVPLPAGTSTARVCYLPDDGFQSQELEEARRRVGSSVAQEPTQLLLWRAYVGDNTGVVDGLVKMRRQGFYLIRFAVQTPLVLVGKVVIVSSKALTRKRRYWLSRELSERRQKREEDADTETAFTCPDIHALDGPVPEIVVAVHGTNASAMAWAAALHNRIPRWTAFFDIPATPTSEAATRYIDRPIIARYEHNTWQPIGDNAKELAARLLDLKVKRAVLIGHSRGGLVVRHATEIAQKKRRAMRVQIVTCGTPFNGTPFVAAAKTSLQGVRMLLGAVRLADGTMAVDMATRIAGLVVQCKLPRGIEAMMIDSDYLIAFEHRTPEGAKTVAGEIDVTDKDWYALGFLERLAPTAFGADPNDLVVASESAGGGLPDPLKVRCDHFSYHEQPEVLAAIDAVVQRTFRAWTPGALRKPMRVGPTIRPHKPRTDK